MQVWDLGSASWQLGLLPAGLCPCIYQMGVTTVFHLVILVTWYKGPLVEAQVLCRVG